MPTYEAQRKPILDKLVTAANASAAWYENFGTHMALPPYDFAMSYLSRTGRMDIERIRKIAPKFVAEYERRKKGRRRSSAYCGFSPMPPAIMLRMISEVPATTVAMRESR